MKTRTRITGFTLVELNVAIVLFLIAVVSALGILSFCTAAAKKSNEFAQCAHLAQSKMAEYLYLNADQVTEVTTPAAFPSPFDKYRYTVRKLNPPGSTLSGFKEIKVTVTGSTGAQTAVVALKNVAAVASILTWSSVRNQKTGYGWCTQQTSDGGYILVGYINSSPGTGWFIKYKADGSVEWEKFYGTRFSAYSVKQTSDGGYIISGKKDSNVSVMKLNPDGSIAWHKDYKTNAAYYDTVAYSVKETSDSGYVIAGRNIVREKVGNGYNYYHELMIVKLNSNGSIAWQKSYGKEVWQFLRSLQQTSDGGYIAAGECTIRSGSSYINSAEIIKINSNGDISWRKTYGSSSASAHSIQQTADGGYVVVGSSIFTKPNGSAYGAWVFKINSDGGIAWQKSYSAGLGCSGKAVQQTVDGGYIMTAETYDVISGSYKKFGCIYKLNSNGNIAWQKNYSGDRDARLESIQQTTDGGYVTGGTYGDNNGSYPWVLKTDPQGSVSSLSSSNLQTDIYTTASSTMYNLSLTSRNLSLTPVSQ